MDFGIHNEGAGQIMANAKQPVLPQAKLIKLLQMVNLLKSVRLTIHEIASRYDVSVRTAYRYVEILDLCEIPIEQDFRKRYFIVNT